MVESDDTNTRDTKRLWWVLGGLFGFSLPWVAWVTISLVGVLNSQCTAEDCKDLRKMISELQIQVVALPAVMPPVWFKERVDKLEIRLEQNFKELDTRLHSLEKAVKDGR